MSPTSIAFLGYILFMLILIISLTSYRGVLTLSGKRAANSFLPSGEDVSEIGKRLCRVHANCYESFPFVGGILIFSIATNNTTVTDPLAIYLIAARVLQGIVHLLSTSVFAVYLRFTFFLIQVVIVAVWLYQFLRIIPL